MTSCTEVDHLQTYKCCTNWTYSQVKS